MAEQQAHDVVRTEDVKGGVPRIEGTRVTVARIQALVEGGGEAPDAVVRRLDVPLPAVYRALAYYHENEELMDELEEEEQELVREALDSGRAKTPADFREEHGE